MVLSTISEQNVLVNSTANVHVIEGKGERERREGREKKEEKMLASKPSFFSVKEEIQPCFEGTPTYRDQLCQNQRKVQRPGLPQGGRQD